jgi:hypothetical protein
MRPRRLTDSHPRPVNPRRGFELMKIRASGICAPLSMATRWRDDARQQQRHEKIGENT